jgi:DNA-damage-inducible protein J
MSVQISTRVDEKTKEEFDYVCQRIGLSASVAMNVFIKAVINERRIPFELKYETELDEYVRENRKWLDEGIAQLKEGKVHTITLAEDD